MLSSLYTAISGLNANGVSLSVIGDNVANMNTVGFKRSRVTFGDVLSRAITGIGGHSQIGRGVIVTGVRPLFNQGSFENTSNALDMAIDGDGFFILKDSEATYYTRAGEFKVDKDGYIVSPDGYRVQGYQYTATGVATGIMDDINISAVNSPPNPTSEVLIAANISSESSTITGGFDIDDRNNTSNFNTTVTVYDSLGNAHNLTIYFTKTATNTWEWNAVADASEIDTTNYVAGSISSDGTVVKVASGTLTFASNGALDTESSVTYYDGAGGGNGIDFLGAAPDQTIDFDFGTSVTTDGGDGLDATTQFGSDSTTLFISQDGYAAGSLSNLNISEDGLITGIFTNGQTKPLAQIALAKFEAPQELVKMGRNLFAESYGSGEPVVGRPANSGFGRVLSNSLELSNVDLAEEFINMISAQRGFQANSRIVSTTDNLLQELVNLKR